MQFLLEDDWVEKFERLTANLSADQIAYAGARALNRATTSAIAAVDNLVAADMRFRVSDVKDALLIKEATPDRLESRVVPIPKRVPLIKFSATGNRPSRGRGRPVSANTGQGGRKSYPNSFLAVVRGVTGTTGNHEGVFVRVGEERTSRGGWGPNLPILQLFGPSVAWVFQKYHDEGLAAGEASLKKNLLSELRFRNQQIDA